MIRNEKKPIMQDMVKQHLTVLNGLVINTYGEKSVLCENGDNKAFKKLYGVDGVI